MSQERTVRCPPNTGHSRVPGNDDWGAESHQDWRHKHIPIVGKQRLQPYIMRQEVENAATSY